MKKTLNQKRLEFLEDTAKFYNSNNRCANSLGSCKYHIDGKDGCAIGRHIKSITLKKKLDSLGNSNKFGISSISDIRIFNLIPKKLQTLGRDFLCNIQELHDDYNNWNDDGISSHGEGSVEFIKIKFEL